MVAHSAATQFSLPSFVHGALRVTFGPRTTKGACLPAAPRPQRQAKKETSDKGNVSCMVCCGLVRAPTELERTQDIHNGTVAARSHGTPHGGGRPGVTRRAPLLCGPQSARRTCAHHALTPETVRPPKGRSRGDRTDQRKTKKRKLTPHTALQQPEAAAERAESVGAWGDSEYES